MQQLLASLALIAILWTAPATADEARTLKLASWNLEWLIAPEAFMQLRGSCVPERASPAGRRRFIPCDVATDLQRSGSDFAALARYARRLDADVIALAEVDGASAARLVFRGYSFCFTARSAVQNTGFAIRPGLSYRCGADLKALSLGDSLRRGAQLVLFPGEPRELRLLAVHLKSGCGRRSLDSGREQCRIVADQVPALEQWIDEQAAAGRHFAVLGDFNRELLNDPGPARSDSGAIRSLWAEIDDGDPPESDLRNAAQGEPFLNCAPNHSYTGYIDHIVLSRSLAARIIPGSFERLTYEPRDALRQRLSDHCPVAIKLSME